MHVIYVCIHVLFVYLYTHLFSYPCSSGCTDVLNLLNCQVVLRPLALVPHSWSILEVAWLDVFESLHPDNVEEQESTHVDLMLPSFVQDWSCGGLAVFWTEPSFGPSQTSPVARLSKDGLVVVHWEEQGAL